MSRGPGRIERAIRQLFDAHPDEAFTTDDLCVARYPGLERRKIEHKHQVGVMRAANKVLAGDLDWRSIPSAYDRRMLIFCSMASVPSMIMRHRLHGLGVSPVCEEEIERDLRWHVTVRDADPAEAERLKMEQEAASAAQLAELAQGIRAALGKPQVLPTAHGYTSATHTALADKARALMVQNDPNAARAGLREIADALSISWGDVRRRSAMKRRTDRSSPASAKRSQPDLRVLPPFAPPGHA